MRRIIKDYTQLTPSQLNLVKQMFPDGIDTDTLTSYPTGNGKRILGFEIKTDEEIILVRFTKADIEDNYDPELDMQDGIDNGDELEDSDDLDDLDED